jgi:16S rRNA (guanine966-N2)-methyltransferase
LGPFLDLFGGSGAVGLEACSRGYGPVVCVEKNPDALALITANARGTAVLVLRKDIRKLNLEELPHQAVIFVDPPYEESLGLWVELSCNLATRLLPGGVLVWESDHRTELPAAPPWLLLESRRYGAARFHFFEPLEG